MNRDLGKELDLVKEDNQLLSIENGRLMKKLSNPDSWVSADSNFKLFLPTPHTKNHVIMSCMKKKKEKEKDITNAVQQNAST